MLKGREQSSLRVVAGSGAEDGRRQSVYAGRSRAERRRWKGWSSTVYMRNTAKSSQFREPAGELQVRRSPPIELSFPPLGVLSTNRSFTAEPRLYVVHPP